MSKSGKGKSPELPDLTIPATPGESACVKKLIPFVGAGVSMGVLRRGSAECLYPSWKELLQLASGKLKAEKKEDLAKLVDTLIRLGKPEDYLEAAKRAFQGLGPGWYDFLREQFDYARDEDDGSLELPRLIWRLGSPIVITTNFDKVLQWTCPSRDDLSVWDIMAPANQIPLLRGRSRQAGCLAPPRTRRQPRHIILTPDGYNRLYLHEITSDTPYKAAIETLRMQLASHSFLFVGFSFNDAHFSAQLRQIEEIYHGAAGPHQRALRRDE